MDGAKNCRYLHESWLHFRVTGAAIPQPFCFHMHSLAHVISLTARGRHAVRWMSRGRETRWDEAAGTVHFTPRDDEQHVFLTTTSHDFESAVFGR